MIKHILLIKLMKKADLILPISFWMGKYIISYGIDPEKVYNFPDGANPELFEISEFPKKIPNPIYVYIGAIAKIRKLNVLIQAMKIVCEKFENAHLYMVGDGDDVSDLKTMVSKLGLNNNITFTGLVPYDKVPYYIQKSHICLCPIPPYYHYKLSSPLKLFEYMSCSRPVIANKEIPAHIKPIKESNCGLLVNYNPRSFANAMIELFSNIKEAEEMGLKGRKWIENNRSYKILAEKLEKKIIKTFFD